MAHDDQKAEALHRRCYNEVLAYLSHGDADAGQFAGPMPENPAWLPVAAVPLPPDADLSSCLALAGGPALPLVQATIAAAHVIRWQQGYREDEVGADYLARSGWCEIAGPDGPLVVPGGRVFVAYWGPELDYQLHWHAAEELYLPLAGSGYFRAEGRAPRWAGPGDRVFHASNQPHATAFGPQGFLALILWRGGELAIKLGIAPREQAATAPQ